MTLSTLAGPARHLYEIKKSRFLALAAPADSPEAALKFLHDVADADATHNCWAYKIGAQYRFSDDGEPAGTAGRPMLQAIEGQGFDRVMVVVTRWFGGIKLGAGGLVRAYSAAAAECLRTAPRVAIVATIVAELRCAFDAMGQVHQLLGTHHARKLDETFDADGARLRIELPASTLPALARAVRDATRGQASVLATPAEP